MTSLRVTAAPAAVTAAVRCLAAVAAVAAGLGMAGCEEEGAIIDCGFGVSLSGSSLTCDTPRTPFNLDHEVGEIRLQRTRTAADGAGSLAAHAYFFTDQDPPTRGFGVPFESTACVDYRDRSQFGGGFSPQAQAIADSRAYVDAGEVVTVTSAGGATIELARAVDGGDAPDTVDRSSGLTHGILYQGPDDVALFESNTVWSFAPAGSDALPDLELRDTESAATFAVLDEPQVVTPPAWTPASITEEELFAGVTISADAPFEVARADEEAAVNEDVGLVGFVSFAGADGIDFMCFAIGAGAGAGAVTVPVEVLDALPDTGTLTVGVLTHLAAEARGLDSGRFDMVGMDAMVTAFTIERP